MKSFFLLCLLTLSGAAFAQQSATITGQIEDPLDDSVRISYYSNLVDFTRKGVSALVDPDGFFTLTLPLQGPTQAFLEHQHEIVELYLQPGDQLKITLDTEDVDNTLSFSGQGALENNCLAEITRRFQDDADFNYSKKSVYANDQAYTKLVDGKFGWQHNFAEKYIKKHPVSEPFKNWLRSEIKFGAALQKMQYPELRGTIVKLEDPYKLSANYYSFISDAEAFPAPDNTSLCYINFKHELVKYEFRKITTNTLQPDYYAKQFMLAQNLLDGEAEAIVNGRLVIDAFRNGQVAYSEQMLSAYKKAPQSKPYLPLVEASANYYKTLARGSKAPDLQMINAEGNTVTLESLLGKVVYLYFYTLGCGSCQMEIAGAREMADQMKGENMEFVFVSVDHDRDTWKKVVTRRPWPGLSGQTVDSAATSQNFRLTKYPTAFIIDTEGRIYDKDAKRLNSLELKDELEAALNEKRPAVHGQLLQKE